MLKIASERSHSSLPLLIISILFSQGVILIKRADTERLHEIYNKV